jgi:hypothetical protein
MAFNFLPTVKDMLLIVNSSQAMLSNNILELNILGLKSCCQYIDYLDITSKGYSAEIN